ncbi:MAG: HD domain-containing protein, partial [Gammaproteobacteria bacterium]|nr:HD domain-containing protein [Gammaproteobacteria bacterium]
LNVFHVIKDPVHGSMQFTTQEDRWIKPFLGSQIFQRLRHIKQLGLADWIFPGAVHTRFNHCIGCCYIGGQIATKLELGAEKKQLVMLACLLHDIGHGPFSHVFEDIFYEKSIHHEDWTPMFLEEFMQPSFLKRFNERNEKTPIDANTIHQIQGLIMHSGEDKLLSDIVSSQLDADRLDYLLRDSHFCGVTYGEYDFRWLLHCLTPVENEGTIGLGITSKGIGVVEQYLMARRLMMRNVYQNGKKYCSEFLLREFLKLLARAIHEEDAFLQLDQSPLVQFLKSVNTFNEKALKTKNRKRLINQFLKSNYSLYKNLCDYDIFSMIRSLAKSNAHHPVIELAKRLHNRRVPRVLYIDPHQIAEAREIIEHFRKKQKIQDWQIALLELPHLSYEMNHDPILIRNFFGATRFLHDDSLMIHAISDKSEYLYLLSIDAEISNSKKMIPFYRSLKNVVM